MEASYHQKRRFSQFGIMIVDFTEQATIQLIKNIIEMQVDCFMLQGKHFFIFILLIRKNPAMWRDN